MVLFVDETENENYFIVTGLLVPSKVSIDDAYRHFKKAIKNYPISPHEKQNVFREFKSVLLDRKYQRIKLKLLYELKNVTNTIIFSCYVKKAFPFLQQEKEEKYIELLNKIVSSTHYEVDVIFDCFNKKDFEADIINSISNLENVLSVSPRDSQLEAGLQFVDNLCSIIRLHKTGNDNYHFYEIIENNVIEI